MGCNSHVLSCVDLNDVIAPSDRALEEEKGRGLRGRCSFVNSEFFPHLGLSQNEVSSKLAVKLGNGL